MDTLLLIYNKDSNVINKAISIFKNSGIGIFPTDTVYGIGCNSLDINALEKLYKLKERNFNKPINILVSNINMINKFVKNVNHIEQKLMENFWPGALTIIFDKTDIVPELLTAGLNTVGIRMPDNKICLELINKLGTPLATSSANISGKTPYTKIDNNIINSFNNKVDFIIDNGETYNIPSTIVRVENDEIRILREGSITKNDILKCFGGNINVR